MKHEVTREFRDKLTKVMYRVGDAYVTTDKARAAHLVKVGVIKATEGEPVVEQKLPEKPPVEEPQKPKNGRTQRKKR